MADDDLLVKVSVEWAGPEHFDRDGSKPCRLCTTPTRMRDNNGQPCHESCRVDELARELYGADSARRLVDERFGPTTEIAQEVQR
jgi:hypothetical protein